MNLRHEMRINKVSSRNLAKWTGLNWRTINKAIRDDASITLEKARIIASFFGYEIVIMDSQGHPSDLTWFRGHIPTTASNTMLSPGVVERVLVRTPSATLANVVKVLDYLKLNLDVRKL